jgi:hypothetical protein
MALVAATMMSNLISRAKISASKIQSTMLNARDKPWAQYVPTMRGILEKINKCEKDVEKIHTSTLVSCALWMIQRITTDLLAAHHANRTPASTLRGHQELA